MLSISLSISLSLSRLTGFKRQSVSPYCNLSLAKRARTLRVRHGWVNVNCNMDSLAVHSFLSSSFVYRRHQLPFVRGLVHLCCRRVHDDRASLGQLVRELAVAAAHELLVVAVRVDRAERYWVALLPVGSAADAHLARDDALDLAVLASFDAVEEARVPRLLDRVGLLQIE